MRNLKKFIYKCRDRVSNNITVRRLPVLLIALSLCLGCLTACDGFKVVFTTGFGEDEVFRIDNAVCELPEVMVYLTNTQNRYEDVYGAEVWNVALDGVTLEQNVKEMVLAKLAQIKTMYLLARSKGVELSDEERAKVERAAEEYFKSLDGEEANLLGVDQKLLLQMYTEYALADKVYQYIIQDINPEISDDEARTITVQHIFLRTYVTDGTGSRVLYTDEVKRGVYEKACEIRDMAVSGEQNFLDLASRYSEDPNLTYSFSKGEMDPAIEAAAFALETDEISDIVESESGYHIIKCISTFDREQTDANKLEIVEERRREVFGQEYDAFVEGLNKNLNVELWEQITFLHDDVLTTTTFFDVYDKYFS